MTTSNTREKTREKILGLVLKDVIFDGWCDSVLEKAAKKAGTGADKAFPGGIDELVLYFSEWADRQTASKIKPAKLKNLRVRDKVALGVKTRLEILSPHKDAVRQALAFMAHPKRGAKMTKQLWKTADVIWVMAGDTATDYNHYTKRILLSGVIASTTMFWLNDDSDESERTWKFLENRIDNVLTLGKFIGKFKKPAHG